MDRSSVRTRAADVSNQNLRFCSAAGPAAMANSLPPVTIDLLIEDIPKSNFNRPGVAVRSNCDKDLGLCVRCSNGVSDTERGRVIVGKRGFDWTR